MAKKKTTAKAKAIKKVKDKPKVKAKAKSKPVEKAKAKPATKPKDNRIDLKHQFEAFFTSWLIKKWTNTKYGNSFILEIKDAVAAKTSLSHKDAHVYLFTNINSETLNISADQIKNWANGPRPSIFIYQKDSKMTFLLLEEHYLNSLFSENPSLTAKDNISIPLSEFTPLTKAKLKDLREFVFKWKENYFFSIGIRNLF
ncbi:MAG: hypothetical protein IPJ60_01480 [Sphingobacteriaceae bacterium]|nr:hypothetical protein [Sphingobacteriaceae bacterium]